MIRFRHLATAFVAASLVACGDSSGPDAHTPGIHVLAGGGQSDTIDVLLPQALVLEVRDTLGALAANQVVRFDVPTDTLAPLLVAPPAGQNFTTFVADTTSAAGQASVVVRLGGRAGTARLLVSVAGYGYVDTVEFTVKPGAGFKVNELPSDTTINVGAGFQMRATVRDRHGNPRTDPVSYVSLDPGLTVSSAGVVTGQTSGIGRVIATAQQVSPDTSRVLVMVAGTIALSVPGGLAIVNLDGSGYQFLPIATSDNQGRYPSWLSPTAIAAMDGRYYADVLRVGTNGSVQYLVPTPDSVVLEVWPQASRDGAWIYFGGLVPGYSTSGISIWRVSPNGSVPQRVSPANVDGVGDTFPSPSPTGDRVAVATTRIGSFRLGIIDVATKTLTTLGVTGLAPRWAPAGDTIAYLNNASEIWLVNADGNGARRVSPPGHSYAPGIDWSPDRRWIVAYGSAGLELIEVASGLAVPLSNMPANAAQPSWKP